MTTGDAWVTLWLRCDRCRNVEGWVVAEAGVFVIPPCELCGSDEVTLADYHPDRKDAA